MKNENKIPKVGLSVIVIRDDFKVLIGKRKGSLGAGTIAFPGGKINYYETSGHCGEREINEETGLEVKILDRQSVAVTEDFFKKENEHWITLFLRAKYLSGEPQVMEPDKCEYWKFVSWKDLIYEKEGPLFLPLRNLIKQQGYNPFF